MASVIALRAILGACLSVGALDLVWINAALAPRLFEHQPEPSSAATQPSLVVAPIEPALPPPEPPTSAAMEPVYFATMSTAIVARTRTALDRVVESVGADAVVVLEGHADHRGDEALNKTLSKDRANAVRNYLVRRGIPRSRIRVDYAGEAPASSELWRDRRVDIQITGGPP